MVCRGEACDRGNEGNDSLRGRERDRRHVRRGRVGLLRDAAREGVRPAVQQADLLAAHVRELALAAL